MTIRSIKVMLIFLCSNSSQASRKAGNRKNNSVEWQPVVSLIEATRADVLVIFDCCYSGSLQTIRAPRNRRFETLGASGYNETTPGPGPRSFTSALIWALGQLKDTDGFDTKELKDKIREAPGFPKDQQNPVLFHHPRHSDEHVWIAPQLVERCGGPLSPSKPSPRYREDRPSEFLDVRFRFSKRQDEQQVAHFAQGLSKFAREEGSSLGIHRMELNDYAPLLKDSVLRLQAHIREKQNPNPPRIIIENQKNERLSGYWAFVTVKAFLSGIFLTLLLWFSFFYIPYQQRLGQGHQWSDSKKPYRQAFSSFKDPPEIHFHLIELDYCFTGSDQSSDNATSSTFLDDSQIPSCRITEFTAPNLPPQFPRTLSPP